MAQSTSRLASVATLASLVLFGCGGNVSLPQSTPGKSIPGNDPSQTITGIQALPDWIWCTRKHNGGVCAAGLGSAQSTMTPNQSSPSLDGAAALFTLGGNAAYSNALWWRPLTVANTITHFTYDLYFYVDNPNAPEALEFDVNQSFGGVRYTWGTECSFRNTGKWDIWNPSTATWVTTSIPCNPVSANSWHHLVWQFERVNGEVHYIGMQLDNTTANVDKLFPPQQNWHIDETDVAFQMDGDFRQTPYKVWLDRLDLTTW